MSEIFKQVYISDDLVLLFQVCQDIVAAIENLQDKYKIIDKRISNDETLHLSITYEILTNENINSKFNINDELFEKSQSYRNTEFSAN